MRNRFRRWGWVLLSSLLLVLAIFFGGVIYWGMHPLPAQPQALAALQSDEQVQVEQGEWTVFRPAGVVPRTGLIFYPGGHVDYRAYAPHLRDIASQGYLVVLSPMPLSLAVLSPDKAGEIIPAFPEITHWVLGGHSLGGAMAARYVYEHPEQARALILWASYPADNNSLAGQNLAVFSIYGTLDGRVDEIIASQALLPAGAVFTPIEGGNHAQFGWYGAQPGDNPATISRMQQQAQAVQATLVLLAQISSPGSMPKDTGIY